MSATCFDRVTIPILEVASGMERMLLSGHGARVEQVVFTRDGRTLASCSRDGVIVLWDAQTGQELRRLKGHRGAVNSILFSGDGKTLISTGDDSTLLHWNVESLTHRPAAPAQSITAQKALQLWHDVASADAAKAYRAVTALIASPVEAIALLEMKMRPASAPEAKRIEKLIADLDSDLYLTRSQATKELLWMEDVVVPALEQKLSEAKSPEARERIESVLRESRSPSKLMLEAIRGIEILEKIGDPAATGVLKKLSQGARSRQTEEAAKALGRLSHQP
jgi:hypothetical protein